MTLPSLFTADPIGTGQYGKTYAIPDDPSKVIKVIEIHDQTQLTQARVEVRFHKLVQEQCRYFPHNVADVAVTCVPLLFEVEEVKIGMARYFCYTIERCEPFQMSKDALEKLWKCNRTLVANRYMHNDLHQGNVMINSDKYPVVIDLGMMTRLHEQVTPETAPYIEFGQFCAMDDNCNLNTIKPGRFDSSFCDNDACKKKCGDDSMYNVHDFMMSKLPPEVHDQKLTTSMQLDEQEAIVRKLAEMIQIRYAEFRADYQLQLLLCYLGVYFTDSCNFDQTLCKDDGHIVNAIYAIRQCREKHEGLLFDLTRGIN